MPKKKNNIKSFNLNIGAHLNKIKVVVLLVIILIIVLYVALSSAPFLNVENIEVRNNQKLSKEHIIELSGITKEDNVLKINKNQVINNLKKDAFIENVSISRVLPKTIEITIKEREPKFLVQVDENYISIDNYGYMLGISPEKDELPYVTGFSTDFINAKAGDRLVSDDTDKLNRVILILESAKNKELIQLISRIDVADLNNCNLVLESEGKTACLGNCSEIDIRMDYLKTIIEQEAGHTGLIFINMDLSTGKAFFREE